MIQLIDNSNINISKLTIIPKDLVLTIELLQNLSFNKLRFKPNKYLSDEGIEINNENLNLFSVIYCCKNINDIFNGPKKKIKNIEPKIEKKTQKDVKRNKSIECKHEWTLNPKDKSKNHVHNFGKGKQQLYVCTKCGAREKRNIKPNKKK